MIVIRDLFIAANGIFPWASVTVVARTRIQVIGYILIKRKKQQFELAKNLNYLSLS